MSDQDIIDEALELHEEAVSGWSLTWDEARDAREFVDDPETQWPSSIRTIRNEEQRPCMVVPLLPPMLSQVENEGVQDLPAMQVSPVDDKVDWALLVERRGEWWRYRASLQHSIASRPRTNMVYGGSVDI